MYYKFMLLLTNLACKGLRSYVCCIMCHYHSLQLLWSQHGCWWWPGTQLVPGHLQPSVISDSPHKRAVMCKNSPCHDIIMRIVGMSCIKSEQVVSHRTGLMWFVPGIMPIWLPDTYLILHNTWLVWPENALSLCAIDTWILILSWWMYS